VYGIVHLKNDLTLLLNPVMIEMLRKFQRGKTMKKNGFVFMVVFVIVSLGFSNIGFCRSANKKVLVVYYSLSGHTKQMAEAAAEGAGSVKGISVKLVSVEKAEAADVLWADGIIVGSPVYNANIAPPVLSFIFKWPFEGEPLRNKIGAAFVSAGGMSAGEELVQMSILQAMLVYGMIVVGGIDWKSSFGASAIVEEEPFEKTIKSKKVNPYFLKKAKGLGVRVARLVLRFNQQ
jgi:NAD(P)H dehydrogenase (quinone)